MSETTIKNSEGYDQFELIHPREFRSWLHEHNTSEQFKDAINSLQPLDSDSLGLEYKAISSMLWVEMSAAGIVELLPKSTSLNSNHLFSGSYEVFKDNDGICRWVKASDDETRLERGVMFDFECRSCGTIMSMGAPNLKPHICSNVDCGRKKNFERAYPAKLENPIWLLPGDMVESTPTQIFEDLNSFYHDHLVLREHEYTTLITWTMASWLVDDFSTCPYLACIAPMSSGKTQVLEAIRHTAYRAYSVASVTPAAIYRAIEQWGVTLCIDEAEYQINSKTESGQAIYACLLAGYKRGVGVLRTEKIGDGWVPVSYDIFGFKAFSGTKIVMPTLASRSLQFQLRKAKPKNDLFDFELSKKIRSALLWYRFKTLHQHKIFFPDSEDGRTRELMAPLFTVSKDLDRFVTDDLHIMMEESIKNKQHEEKQSIEAELISIISDLSDLDNSTLTGERTLIYVKELVDALGWDPNRGSSTRLGKTLKAMGLQSRHTKIGNVIDLYDADNEPQLKYLMERYL